MHRRIAADLGKWTKFFLSPNSLLRKKHLKNFPRGNKFLLPCCKGEEKSAGGSFPPYPFPLLYRFTWLGFTCLKGRDNAEKYICFLFPALCNEWYNLVERSPVRISREDKRQHDIFTVRLVFIQKFSPKSRKNSKPTDPHVKELTKHKRIDQLNFFFIFIFLLITSKAFRVKRSLDAFASSFSLNSYSANPCQLHLPLPIQRWAWGISACYLFSYYLLWVSLSPTDFLAADKLARGKPQTVLFWKL